MITIRESLNSIKNVHSSRTQVLVSVSLSIFKTVSNILFRDCHQLLRYIFHNLYDDDLASLCNGILPVVGYLMQKPFLEEQSWNYLTQSLEDKGIHTFPNGICLKVNFIARLEFKLVYYNSAVHHFNHYTTSTPSLRRTQFYLYYKPEVRENEIR